MVVLSEEGADFINNTHKRIFEDAPGLSDSLGVLEVSAGVPYMTTMAQLFLRTMGANDTRCVDKIYALPLGSGVIGTLEEKVRQLISAHSISKK